MIPKELFAKIRRIEIRTKGLVNNVFGGEYHSAFKGRGIEFSEVRPYQVGDDIRSIDWNVTARTSETFVKIFEEEREQTLLLVVDISGSSDFGTQDKFKREIAAEICAILGFSAIKNNDKVGLLLFSDQVELFVPPKSGRRHVLRLIRDMFAHQPQSTGTSLQVALNHILRVIRRRSIVLLVSDFLDKDFERPLRMVSRRHDTVAVQLTDPRETILPPLGLVTLFDPETKQSQLIDTGSRSVRNVFQQSSAQANKQLKSLLRKARVDHVEITCGEDFVDPLAKFFRARAQIV
ncbi:MAG: DUF58 domain-containing protein [Bacteroidetes bacterium]|nr:DUF58 domain-containing protein [Bacteroidota bacterium]MCY4223357.1 DUF58 domain-containing protein [Bacteroidota bacterium]